MGKNSFYILGAGGHGKVVIHTAILSGKQISGLYDDDTSLHNKVFAGVEVCGNIYSFMQGSAFIAIGNNRLRKEISQKIVQAKWETIIHPNAIVSSDVSIGEGTVVMAGAIVQPGVRIGKHCIINTGACVDHDCEIDDFSHIAPNCSLAGGVKVGEGALIGIGSSIIPNKKVGKWTIIGAGSVVVDDQTEYSTCFGVPAKPVKNQNGK